MEHLCKATYKMPAEKVVYAPLWSPVEKGGIHKPEETLLGKRLDIKGKFVVQYSGNMGLWHDLETIVRAAKILESNKNIHFVLIGDGMRKAKAKILAETYGLGNITWLPFQPLAHLEDSLACCHLALISQREGMCGVAVPCKLYGILAAGRPILAQVPHASETALTILEEKCGLVVAPGDETALADAINDMASKTALVEKMGRAARNAYTSKYTLESACDRFAAFFGTGAD
jgi:glycosyltransferase involved in cell wall biosynthesis